MTASNLVLALFCLLPPLCLLGSLAVYRAHRRRGRSLMLLIAGNLLFLGALLGLLLSGGEVYYRFFCDETDGFDLGLVSERWFRRHYAHNNLGLRDDIDYALSPDPARPRWTFVGDSYTNGHGLADVRQRFTNLLRSRRPDEEIHAIAGDGLETPDLEQKLEALVRAGYGLDRVVYVYCLNDISDLIPEWREASSRIYEDKPGFWVRESYLLNTWHYRLLARFEEGLAGYFDYVAAAYEGELWPIQVARLDRLTATVQGSGGRLAVVTFPFFERRDSPRYRAIHARLAQYWNGRGIPQLDLLDVFAGHDLGDLAVSPRDTHAGKLAHRLAADAIDPWLSTLWPPPA